MYSFRPQNRSTRSRSNNKRLRPLPSSLSDSPSQERSNQRQDKYCSNQCSNVPSSPKYELHAAKKEVNINKPRAKGRNGKNFINLADKNNFSADLGKNNAGCNKYATINCGAQSKKPSKKYENGKTRTNRSRKFFSTNSNDGKTLAIQNQREELCSTLKSSNSLQDGSGDAVPKQGLISSQEQEKLDRFRRINMKIIEAVSQLKQEDLRRKSSISPQESQSDLQSLEKSDEENEDDEEILNQEALQACFFLSQNYPYYFQHLINRYQLDVTTTDEKEMLMKKMDIIRIAGYGEDRLRKLENMCKEKPIRHPLS